MPDVLIIALGLAGLVVGCELAVRGARVVADSLGVSGLVVGLTLTSIGTSLPEIATNLAVAFSGASGTDASGVAVGNIVGSNLSQITLLLGVAAMLAPLPFSREAVRREGVALVGAMVAMMAVCVNGVASRLEGGLLVALYAVYLGVVVVQERGRAPQVGGRREGSLWRPVLVSLAGLLLVVFCADLVVGRSVELARAAQISETLIGLAVGLGTGLPEMTVAIRAVLGKEHGLSVGNLVGSNITDPLLSFGIGALVWPVTVPMTALRFDFVYWAVCTAVALTLLGTQERLERREAAVLLLLFFMYVWVRVGVISG